MARGRPRNEPPIPQDPDDTPPPLTRKERKFLALYLEHGDVGRAALESKIYKPKGKKENGYRPNAVFAGRNLLKRIGPQIEQMMDQEGMSVLQLMRYLSSGLDAETAQAVEVLSENGVPKRDEKGRFVREIITVPDHRHRVKYLEIALKLRNAFPAQPAVVKVQGGDESKPIQVQHMESIAHLSTEEKQRRLDEIIEASKRGPLRIVK